MLMGTIPADVPFQAVLSQHTTLGCFQEAYSNQNFATTENLRCSRLMVGANPASDMLQCVPDGLFYLKAGAKAPCTHRPFPQAANHKQQGVQTGTAERGRETLPLWEACRESRKNRAGGVIQSSSRSTRRWAALNV